MFSTELSPFQWKLFKHAIRAATDTIFQNLNIICTLLKPLHDTKATVHENNFKLLISSESR